MTCSPDCCFFKKHMTCLVAKDRDRHEDTLRKEKLHHPVDSDMSNGKRYPHFLQLDPAIYIGVLKTSSISMSL